jgi:hypothetical protein
MAVGRFVAYYRVSTDRQGRSGLGLEAQRETVQRYLNGGNWTLADVSRQYWPLRPYRSQAIRTRSRGYVLSVRAPVIALPS